LKGVDLKRFAIFGDLAEDEREEVADVLEARRLARGETLFREGDDADYLVLVSNGRLGLTSGRAKEQAVVSTGAALGGLSLFAVGPREITAVGAEASELWLLRREDFRRLVEDHPRVACRIAEAIATQAAGHARLALDALSGRSGSADSVDPDAHAE
jgi:CRP-like cAMP-binding protein